MALSSEMQKMLAGELYDAGDAEIQTAQTAAKHWMARYNAAADEPASFRRELLRERLAGKVEVDHNTARRLFTLICVLHIRG